MAKELRIEIVVELPEGLFQEAALITSMGAPLDALRTKLTEMNATFTSDARAVVPKARGTKDAEPDPATLFPVADKRAAA